ncbi:hypothetical protein [Priestia aryabhattai]
MFKNEVTKLGEMKLKEIEELDQSKKVSIKATLPESMVVEQKLSNYYITVTIYDDKTTDVLVYEAGVDDSLPIGFTSQLEKELVKFAEKQLKTQTK